MFQLGNYRVKSAVLVVRRTEVAQTGMRVLRNAFQKGLRETRLADTRFAGDQHDRALASFGLLPAALQKGQLLVSANERRAGCAQRFKTTFGSALAQYTGRDDRRNK